MKTETQVQFLKMRIGNRKLNLKMNLYEKNKNE